MNAASLWGPLSVLLVAAGGWFFTRRKTKADAADMITKAAGNLATIYDAQLKRTEARAAAAEEAAARASERAEAAEQRAAAAERRAAEAAEAVRQRDRIIAGQSDEIAALRARVDELEQHDRTRTGEHPIVPPGSPT